MTMDKTILAASYKADMLALYADPTFISADTETKADMIFETLFGSIIEHIKDYAQLTFRTSDSGIQKSTAIGSDTDAPDADVPLNPGQIS